MRITNATVPMKTLLLTVVLSSQVAAAEWPEFRGPTGQGHAAAKNLPIEWGPDKNVAWKKSLLGSGWSSPVVGDGRIFLTAAVPTDDSEDDISLRLLCLDAKSGRAVWDCEVFSQDADAAPRIHRKNSHASPTPIVHEDGIYVHFGHQGTACLNRRGDVVWKSRDVRYRPVHGNGGSPAICGELLVFSADGAERQRVVALNRHSGKLVWQTDRDVERFKKFAFSTPLVIQVEGRQQIVSPGAGMVGAYDPDTGEELWRVDYDGYSVVPRPVFGHGLVFVSTGFDSPSMLAIRPDGRGNVTDTHVAWRLARGAPHTPSPLLVGEELYLVSDRGVASCVNAKTGQIHWQERLGGNYSASPLHAARRIYFQSEDGVGTVIEAAKTFRQLARNDLEERTLASYAVTGDALLIRTEKHLYRIENP